MSTPPKARGGQASELTKLKLLDAAKQEVVWSWREEIVDGKPLTNALIRNRIAKQFSIRLGADKQLSEFWRWFSAQQELEQSNDLIEQFEEFTRKQNPDWTADKVRDMGIQFFMAHTVAKKDANKFASIVSLDQNERFGRTKATQKEREIRLKEQQFIVDSDVYFERLLKKANELNVSNLSNADKIAAMRAEAFKSVDELQASGKIKIPKV